jgi:hypothetical protein
LQANHREFHDLIIPNLNPIGFTFCPKLISFCATLLPK